MKFLSQINVNTEYTLPIVDGTNGQVLATDGNGNAYWGSISAGSTNLDALTDVILTSPSSGQLLRYGIPPGSGETQPVWYNFTPNYLTPSSSIDNLGDVTITSATAGQILQWNGTAWVNATLSTVDYVSKVQHIVKAGVAITKGQAVYVTSSDGTNMVVGLASNTSEGTSSKVMGLAASSAAINGQIFVVTEGLLAGLNTSTATAGDPVWLGANGNLIFGLLNKPVSPAHLVYIGVVTRVQQNNGEIFVKVQNGIEIDEIHDVQISSPATGQLLRRDSDGYWKNWTPNYLTAHPTIANGGSVDNSNGTVIQDITLETNGHVTAITSVDLDTRYYTQNDISGIFGGEIPMAGYSPTNWDAAYGWGNHASAGYATTSYVTTAIANLVDSAPSTLDTLNELAAALGDDPNFATTVTNSIATKLPLAGGTLTGNLYMQAGTQLVLQGWGESHSIFVEPIAGASNGKTRTIFQAADDFTYDQGWEFRSYRYDGLVATRFYIPGDGSKALMNGANVASETWVNTNFYNQGDIEDFFGGVSAISGYNKSNWDTAYNDKVNSASFNTTNGILTLTQQDGGTVTVDLDGRYLTSDTDAQTLAWEAPTKNLSITNGNTVTLEGLATEDYVLSQGFISSEADTLASVTGRGASTNTSITVGPDLVVQADGGVNYTASRLKLNSHNNYRGAGMHLTGVDSNWFVGTPYTDFAGGFVIARKGAAASFEDTAQYSNALFTVKSNGNVGIGTTAPGFPLHVIGKIYANPYHPVAISGGGSPYYGSNITMASDIGATAGAVRVWSRYDGSGYAAMSFERATNSQAYGQDPQLLTYSETMRISGTGNVGIGTTSPAYKLDVSGGFRVDGINGDFIVDSNGNDIYFTRNGTNYFYGNQASSSFAFYTNSNLGLFQSSAGNVGIGRTPASNERFTVNAAEGVWALAAYRSGAQIGGIHVNDSILNVQGSGGIEVRLSTSGNATWNGDVLATRTWVQAQGYITGYTETDTLATVTARGSSTTGSITVNGYLTVAGGADLYLKAGTGSSDSGDIVFQDGTGAELHRLWSGTNTLNYRTNAGTSYQVIHSGNIGSYAWTSANDGASSGLDADLLDGQHGSYYQAAATAITTANIGSQSVAYAGEAGFVSNQGGQLLRFDNRTISPSETSAGYLQFGFTSWTNNNGAPYADYLHMRSYTDASGGSDNLVMFKKSGIGMRIWQQSWGSSTAYSSYADVWTTENFTSTNVTNWNTAYGWGNHADAPYWNVSLNQNIQVESQQVTFAGDVVIQGTLTESSSIRFKENIAPLDPALDKVSQLEAVSYNKIGEDNREIGLIAEDVAELFPEVVTYNEEGQPQGIQYQRLSVILLKAVQELTERVNKLENK